MNAAATLNRIRSQHPDQPLDAIQNFLNDHNDPRIPRFQALYSSLPNPDLHQGCGDYRMPRDEAGTSPLVSAGEKRSPTRDLPGLTRGQSVLTAPPSLSSSLIARESSRLQQCRMREATDSSLELPPVILGCPFHFLGCYLTFSNEAEWITHSLTHFHHVGPPTTSLCPLCGRNDLLNWNLLMKHVALHHVQGERLETPIIPDFDLYRHLWRHDLLTTPSFRLLMGTSDQTTAYTVTEKSSRRRGRP